MHTLPYSVLRAAPRYSALTICRRVAGRRLPQPRSFRTTSHLRRRDDGASDRATSVPSTNDGSPELGAAGTSSQRPAESAQKETIPTEPYNASESAQEGKPSDADKTNKGADKRFYGSWRKRATRGNQEHKIDIPDWFLDNNVKLYDVANVRDDLVSIPDDRLGNNEEKLVNDDGSSEPGGSEGPKDSKDTTSSESAQISHGLYQIDKPIMEEILYMASAGLRTTSNPRSEDIAESRPHLLLQSPKDGAQAYLEALVDITATELGADVVSIDAQDIAEIASDNADIIPEANTIALRKLGFDTHTVVGDDPYSNVEDNEGTEEFDEEAEEDEPDNRGKPPSVRSSSGFPIHIRPLNHMIQSLFPPRIAGAKFIGAIGPVQIPTMGSPSTGGSSPFSDRESSNEVDSVLVIESFLDAVQLKRRATRSKSSSLDTDPVEVSESGSQSAGSSISGLIILIKDYLEMNATAAGSAFLKGIHAAVGRRRRRGQAILIAGTTSSSDLMPSVSKSGFRSLQSGSEQDNYRTIVVPCKSPDADSLFTEDLKLRTRKINCRNILAVLRQLSSEPQQIALLSSQSDLGFRSEQIFAWDLDESVWTFDKVQRIASMSLGLVENGEMMTAEKLDQALKILESSDDSKFAWLDLEREKTQPPSRPNDTNPLKREQSSRIKQLQKTCNRHEKKLLNGVIDASSINTTFGDVHAPESTIEALKTLTSLSLIRPDAFKYGVLATDKIPGLLLYGPPGTGKTLLAKAVAKESGATVLEVAGSDVYDMYVGEGEKNVRAIFSLTKKLSPCIVFIDEADAIFGSRSTSTNRTSHRELINQFLREWDGMNDLSAFIMVATNRPFDLDDAVLRRLPRRLLVDLPTEKDREAILQIHLKGEVLDPNVSLSSIASKTPYYSGSDLKNLSVAAALACVREENEEAAKHTGSEPYIFPEKRTLTEGHFEKAISEISASISEDMSSLAAIRKFDEKYGDRRGRRKKLAGWGFGNLTESEKERVKLEEGRVRTSEVGA